MDVFIVFKGWAERETCSSDIVSCSSRPFYALFDQIKMDDYYPA